MRAGFSLEPVHGVADGGMIGDVEGQFMNCRACIAQGLCGKGELASVAAIHHDGGTRCGKTGGDGLADALRRSGDQGGLAGEVEKRMGHMRTFGLGSGRSIEGCGLASRPRANFAVFLGSRPA